MCQKDQKFGRVNPQFDSDVGAGATSSSTGVTKCGVKFLDTILDSTIGPYYCGERGTSGIQGNDST